MSEVEMKDSKKIGGNTLADPSPNTKSKRNQATKREKSGLAELKVYLGSSTMEKLALIYEHQYERTWFITKKKKKDIEGIASVLSYCIEQCFDKVKGFQAARQQYGARLPPANTPVSQKIVRLHQVITFRFNRLNDKDPRQARIRSMAQFMMAKRYTALGVLDGRGVKGKLEWSNDDIETLLDIEKVAALIKKHNISKSE